MPFRVAMETGPFVNADEDADDEEAVELLLLPLPATAGLPRPVTWLYVNEDEEESGDDDEEEDDDDEELLDADEDEEEEGSDDVVVC